MDDDLRQLFTGFLHRGASSLETVVTRLHGLDGGLQEAERACHRVSTATETSTNALDRARVVVDALDRSDRFLKSAQDTFAAFDDILRQVNDRARVLSEIADQSNILAVNATIEAARAGERGKGFQVVADSMRALARQSAGAALEIGDLLDEGGLRIGRYREDANRESQASEAAIDTARASFGILHDETQSLQNETQGLIRTFLDQMGELSRVREQIQRTSEDYSGMSVEIMAALSGIMIRHVDVGEAEPLMHRMPVVDVRTPEEFADDIGRIRGAVNVPVGNDLPEGLRRFDPKSPIMFVCRRGGRSARAARVALDLGFEQVWNLKAGMEGWQSAGLPMETGHPA